LILAQSNIRITMNADHPQSHNLIPTGSIAVPGYVLRHAAGNCCRENCWKAERYDDPCLAKPALKRLGNAPRVVENTTSDEREMRFVAYPMVYYPHVETSENASAAGS
jgi:hypothetical protein